MMVLPLGGPPNKFRPTYVVKLWTWDQLVARKHNQLGITGGKLVGFVIRLASPPDLVLDKLPGQNLHIVRPGTQFIFSFTGVSLSTRISVFPVIPGIQEVLPACCSTESMSSSQCKLQHQCYVSVPRWSAFTSQAPGMA